MIHVADSVHRQQRFDSRRTTCLELLKPSRMPSSNARFSVLVSDDTSLDEHFDAPEPSYAPSMTLVHCVSCVEPIRLREGLPATDAKGEMLDEKVNTGKVWYWEVVRRHNKAPICQE